MTGIKLVKETWLSQKVRSTSFGFTLIFSTIFFLIGYIYLLEIFPLKKILPANYILVFTEHQYWRAWTTQFAHGDLVHLLSNLMLLVPLAFLLFNYFGIFIFPIVGFFMGGIINLVVLLSMPEETFLVGASGLVYWMGATWFSLYFLLDTRRNLKRRFAAVVILTALLFFPESYKPEISYYSHFIGYILGLLSGALIYFYRRTEFKRAEIIEIFVEEDEELENLVSSDTHIKS